MAVGVRGRPLTSRTTAHVPDGCLRPGRLLTSRMAVYVPTGRLSGQACALSMRLNFMG
jgi:hypothetical protein